jgi:hypothetical protein
MSTKLRNRRLAEDKLGSFLEQALVGEDLIHTILDAPVGLCARACVRSCVLSRRGAGGAGAGGEAR